MSQVAHMQAVNDPSKLERQILLKYFNVSEKVIIMLGNPRTKFESCISNFVKSAVFVYEMCNI